MQISAIRTSVFTEGGDLFPFIAERIPSLAEGSIVVVTSKIAALAERRIAEVRNKKEKEKIIRRESKRIEKTKYVWLTLKDGMALANAGVDESNANGKLILLPSDSFALADSLRKKLMRHYILKKLGVIISDSRTMPMRRGVVGIALGYAGFKGLRDYRGKKDIFGRSFVFTSTDVADSLATAATVVMGEGNERQPLAVITDAPVVFTAKTDIHELRIDPKDDMYRLFKRS